MNVNECVGFLGHSSSFPLFDSFLANNQIMTRPKGKESYETLKSLDHKTVLSFQLLADFKEESLIPVKSEGKSILSEIEVHTGNTGTLPYGLSFKDRVEDIKKKLNNIVDNVSIPERNILTFHHDSLLISIFFNKNKEIFMIKMFVPSIYDKKNLGIEINNPAR
ncbi:hypothetical protein IBH50_002105 [Salmonella enterica]|uniref:Uncharacterized protein n=1 Tax=Salmonella enterica TaxID=28901 RepID=A0A754KU60_SALER|nr:hypothetical protein [Salmonella enterica]EBR8476681.1 hypothetical protein [Salmonella enterica subsp. enterica serovar Nima]EBV7250881.1 hypothetical protein [Salmonella enterica subsp. enterica serovar Pomona]EDS7028555.1 hypothetical protein [Salmonella enterica subsp. enterica]EAW2797130.1 hypothetical protein [Salmonella enterica]